MLFTYVGCMNIFPCVEAAACVYNDGQTTNERIIAWVRAFEISKYHKKKKKNVIDSHLRPLRGAECRFFFRSNRIGRRYDLTRTA